MQLNRSDYYLARFCYRFSGVLNRLSTIENHWLPTGVVERSIDRPIFITGLARSGSTILLELLSRIPGLGTHRYSDFPFLATPWTWDLFQRKFSNHSNTLPVERPHRDKIHITSHSPESMEEPLWQAWFPWIHSPEVVHEISAETSHPRFECFYREHINKILLIRGASRYAAKNNYHLTRIEYLLRLFPDARFIIPVRHPVSHVDSLMRQHALFLEYSRESQCIGPYLQAAGHYEFGPQRVPIQLNLNSISEIKMSLQQQRDHVAYAIQWRDVYQHALDLLRRMPNRCQQVIFVKHEDFCIDPHIIWGQIAEVCQLSDVTPKLEHVVAPKNSVKFSPQQKSDIWEITNHVASELGYSDRDEFDFF